MEQEREAVAPLIDLDEQVRHRPSFGLPFNERAWDIHMNMSRSRSGK